MKTCVAFVALTLLASWAVAQDEGKIPFYGNAKCPISGKDVDRKIYVEHEGQKIYTCCANCQKKVKEDPAAALVTAYPPDKVSDVKNELCPIMGNKAKENVTLVFQGHRVHFCCPGCNKKFMQQPNKHLALLQHQGLKDMGNTHCPMLPEEEVAPDTFLIYKNMLINICCVNCAEDFNKDPQKYLKSLKGGKDKEGEKKGGQDH